MYGLTGTPLLDNSDRVIELANLIGCTYILGLASHWRKLERESRRDIFLQQITEPKQTREIRKAKHSCCQKYLRTACCRNTAEQELLGIQKVETTVPVRMTQEDQIAYEQSQNGIQDKGLHIKPGDFDPTAGHDISIFLKQNASLPSRGHALVKLCQRILNDHKQKTKIVVFADGRIGAGHAARNALLNGGLQCTFIEEMTVEEQNKAISAFQRCDLTVEDSQQPHILVLNFDHAAGLNLQKECHNLILFNPLYVGDGGTSGDPVSDASQEQQAIGRVFRPGQVNPYVYVHRIELQGPNGESCLDRFLIDRTTDDATIKATTNAAEEESSDEEGEE
jgi:hypothetical protein